MYVISAVQLFITKMSTPGSRGTKHRASPPLQKVGDLYVVHDKLEEVREVIKVSGGFPIMQPESGGNDMI